MDDALAEVGILFLVVGPSGAGKDTLLDRARKKLHGDDRYVFARRVITRPSEPDYEDHESVSPDEFNRLLEDGAFSLSWEAHGLKYGIPMTYEVERQKGRHVIANVSRQIAVEARKLFSPARIVVVTAPKELLAARLSLRSRESAAEIKARLSRQAPEISDIDGAVIIENSGTVADGVTALLRALKFRDLAATP
tara:strand:- start:581 stop:1162 length:582 start_codon:yes stop_codon:yes gene_type:complete